LGVNTNYRYSGGGLLPRAASKENGMIRVENGRAVMRGLPEAPDHGTHVEMGAGSLAVDHTAGFIASGYQPVVPIEQHRVPQETGFGLIEVDRSVAEQHLDQVGMLAYTFEEIQTAQEAAHASGAATMPAHLTYSERMARLRHAAF
jgi:hypothetical protein